MKVLGIAGGMVSRTSDDPVGFPSIDGYWHDAAAVLMADGVVLAGHEEERASGLKHTTRFPSGESASCQLQNWCACTLRTHLRVSTSCQSNCPS